MHRRFPSSFIKMTYATLVLFLMCLGGGYSVHLTKEIALTFAESQSPQAADFSNIIAHLLQPSEAIVKNLAVLLSSTIEPKVPDVLNAVNSGLGVQLLIIADDTVQVNALELEAALIRAAKDVSQALYPNDYVKQMTSYAVMQNKALEISTEIQSRIAASKIPVKRFEEVLENRIFLMKRDVQTRDLFSDIYEAMFATIQTAICDVLVSGIKTVINSTMSNWINTFENIDVTSSGDPISSVLSSLVKTGIFFLEQGLNCSEQWLENDASNTCRSLITFLSGNSTDTAVRERRDVNESLNSVLQRDIFTNIFTGIWSSLWGLFATVANPVVKMAINFFITMLGNILNAAVDAAL